MDNNWYYEFLFEGAQDNAESLLNFADFALAPTFPTSPPSFGATPLSQFRASRPLELDFHFRQHLCIPRLTSPSSGVSRAAHTSLGSGRIGSGLSPLPSWSAGGPSNRPTPAPRASLSSRFNQSPVPQNLGLPPHEVNLPFLPELRYGGAAADSIELPPIELPPIELPPIELPPIELPSRPNWNLNDQRDPRDPHPPSSPRREPNSDEFLNELVNRNFSSPSILARSPRRPSGEERNNTNPWDEARLSASAPDSPHLHSPAGSLFDEDGDTSDGGSDIKREGSPADEDEGYAPLLQYDFGSDFREIDDMSTRPQRTRGGRGSRSSPAVIDIASGPASSPPSSRRRRPTPQSTSRQTPTRRPPMKRKRDTVEDSSIEDAFRAVSQAVNDSAFAESDDEGVKVIDLANADQMPPPPVPPPKPKNEVKLSAFQCVICMDDVTDLTVTHCGHLFCSECLHSSLHIESHKRICPICRQKIDPRPANGQFSVRAKGYYPLELKLVTKKSLGKRPVR